MKIETNPKNHKLGTPSEHSTIVNVHSRSKRFHRDVCKTAAKRRYTLHEEKPTQLSHLEILQLPNSILFTQKFPAFRLLIAGERHSTRPL